MLKHNNLPSTNCFNALVSKPYWTKWCFDSRLDYESRFAQRFEERTYENSFAYLQQECRYNAAMFAREDLVATVYSRSEESSFAIFLPCICPDETAIKHLPGLCDDVRSATGRRVILRKCSREIFERLKDHNGFRVMYPGEYENPRELPEDIFPQVVVDVQKSAPLQGHAFRKIRNHIRSIQKLHLIEALDFSSDMSVRLTNVIGTWAAEYNDRVRQRTDTSLKIVNEDGVDIDSYTIFTERFDDLIDNRKYFARVVLVDGQPRAFCFAGRTGTHSAGLYVSLCMDRKRGISEFMLVDMMERLQQHGVRFLNLGGSETATLFDYKRKWQAESLRPSFELEYFGV